MASDTVQIVTTALAVLGAVLGCFNAWRAWIKDRAVLRVSVAFGQSADGWFLLVEMLNLSAFPLTVTQIGFDLLSDNRTAKPLHAQIPIPVFMGGEALPVRLESRTSCVARQSLAAPPNCGWELIACAYVRTACGLKSTGGAKTFNELRVALATKD